VEILYMATSGTSDATKASIPIHLAVNGSVEAGQTPLIFLAGDATELVHESTREAMEGVGVPPMRELFAKVRQHEVPVFV
jgi:predicted peroxiredoxin